MQRKIVRSSNHQDAETLTIILGKKKNIQHLPDALHNPMPDSKWPHPCICAANNNGRIRHRKCNEKMANLPAPLTSLIIKYVGTQRILFSIIEI